MSDLEKSIQSIKYDIENFFYKLVSIRSDTGTIYERDIEKTLIDELSKFNYFKENKDRYGQYIIEEDNLKRSVIWALVKGEGEDTIVLMHHHDAVDSLDYGVLYKYALEPNRLQELLGEQDITKEVRKDLESNEWIFGRGTCDMKAGAAIQLSLLKKYSELKDFKGNILLISVPDEESLSIGMRYGVSLLHDLKTKFNLNYKLMINSEPHSREHSKAVIHTGSVGKLMPVIFVRGKKTHIGNPFEGFNPLFLLSRIASKIELNTEFCDVVGDEISPPPTWAYIRDRKENYDASMPEYAGGYFSILSLNRTPNEVLNTLKKLCHRAFEEAIGHVNHVYYNYNSKVNKDSKYLKLEPKVKIFSEVYKDAVANGGEEFLHIYNECIEELKVKVLNNEISLPESNFMLIEKVMEYVEDRNPCVIIAFSPPYYPATSNMNFSNLDNAVSNIIHTVNKVSKEKWNTSFEEKKYFMGISDMSYTALYNSNDVVPIIEPNMPLWGKLYSIPFEKIEKINMPSVNIGPWGKDLHKFTERVWKEDLFDRIPILINRVIEDILNN